MGSSRKPKSTRAKNARPGERPPTREILPKTSNRAPAEALEIPPGVLVEIEDQRGVLVTVITLLHCLHVVLQQREDSVDNELNPRIEAAARWASLPEMTAMLLERTHAVLSALDSVNLAKALKAFKP
jgi:hypothetical protein